MNKIIYALVFIAALVVIVVMTPYWAVNGDFKRYQEEAG